MVWNNKKEEAYWKKRIAEEDNTNIEELEDDEIEELIDNINFRDGEKNIIRY